MLREFSERTKIASCSRPFAATIEMGTLWPLRAISARAVSPRQTVSEESTMTEERYPKPRFGRVQMATKYLPKKELRSAQNLGQLSPLQREIAKQIYDSVGHLLFPTFEHWERQCQLDLFPDRPLSRWLKISKAYESYRAHHADITDPEMLRRVLVILSAISYGIRFTDPASLDIQAEFIKLDVTD
jgi:hypothetical protein